MRTAIAALIWALLTLPLISGYWIYATYRMAKTEYERVDSRLPAPLREWSCKNGHLICAE